MKAVEQAKEMGISDLNVHTDSKFLIDCKFFYVYLTMVLKQEYLP